MLALGEAVNSAHSLTSKGKELLTQFGALVGRQLVAGGALVTQELVSRVRGHLLSAFDGQRQQHRSERERVVAVVEHRAPRR